MQELKKLENFSAAPNLSDCDGSINLYGKKY